VPDYHLETIDERPFSIKGVEIVPIRVFHYKLPVLGFRFGRLAYITDANRIPEEEFEKLKGLEILVLNTVRRGHHISHFSLEEAIEVAQRIGAKRTFLTHLSHQLPRYEELLAELPEGIEPAYDGLEIEF
ncbi:MAG: MBL fold metallo-hydrolase, partial [Bacteroidales bacterium]|nr:MBL fold metallo-hydrolase [Bacteroidales bacterium]